MPTVEVEADVPESRQVTITLPPSVPTGRVRLTVTVADPPGPLPPYRPDNPALVAEYEAFHRLLPDLVRTHLGQYVAVAGGRVVAAGTRPDAVEAEARAAVGDVPAYIGVVHRPPTDTVVRFGGVRTAHAGVGG